MGFDTQLKLHLVHFHLKEHLEKTKFDLTNGFYFKQGFLLVVNTFCLPISVPNKLLPVIKIDNVQERDIHIRAKVKFDITISIDSS